MPAFALRLRPLPLIDPAHILADRDHVRLGNRLGAHSARAGQFRQRLDRGEFAVEIEGAAHLVNETLAAGAAEQRPALGKDFAREIGYFRRKAAATDSLGRIANGPAHPQVKTAGAVPLQYRQTAQRHRHNLWPHPLAGQNPDDMKPVGIESPKRVFKMSRQARSWQFLHGHDVEYPPLALTHCASAVAGACD